MRFNNPLFPIIHGLVLWGLTCHALAQAPLAGSERTVDKVGQRQYARLPLLDQDIVAVPWKKARHDFFFRLPEHVTFGEDSSLNLVLHGSRALLQSLCSVTIEVNENPLYTGRPVELDEEGTNDPSIRFLLPVDRATLLVNWNRVTVRFNLGAAGAGEDALEDEDGWEIRTRESFLLLAYDRQELFPELRRFPYTLTEEQLLRPRLSASEPLDSAVALLLPEDRRDIHFRGVAVLGACLGKPSYFEESRLAGLASWNLESMERNGLILGRRDELDGVEFPDRVRASLDALKEGEGVLAEMILGRRPFQRRWLLVSGADDTGVEKALLTLAHEEALLVAPPNPSLIAEYPVISEALEKRSRPGKTSLRLGDDFLGADIMIRGLYQSDYPYYGWKLPPGHETGPGGLVTIGFAHSMELKMPGSSLEVLINGLSLGVAELSAATASGGEATFAIPEGLRGVEPMTVTFRVYLDLEDTACDPPPSERAWLAISGDSSMVVEPRSLEIRDLQQTQAFMAQDLFLRQTAMVVPFDSSLKDLQWLMNLSIRMGHGFSGSAVLWPEACGYGPEQLPDAERLRGRQVLLLGSVAQLPHAMPNGQRFLARMDGPYVRSVYLQGRRYEVADFEPSLSMVTLFDSPWSPGKKLVTAGGWRGYAMPSLSRMLTDPVVQGNFYGQFSAMDLIGRSASYNPDKSQPESLAQCLIRNIPLGLTAEETVARQYALESGRRKSALINFGIFLWTMVILLLLTFCRIWLMWERARLHRRHRKLVAESGSGERRGT